MNLVGKVLIMLIFIMSLVFMSFSVAVYATHKNWKEVVDNPPANATLSKPAGLKFQLVDLEKSNSQLVDASEALSSQLKTERERHVQAIGKLESKRQELLALVASINSQLNEKQVAYNSAHETMLAVQGNYTALASSITALQGEVLAANDARDQARREIITTTAELHNSVVERERLANRNNDLTEQMVQAGSVLKMHGLKADPNIYLKDAPPWTVHGVVVGLGNGTIGISVGADDGVMRGHQFIIYRIVSGQKQMVGRAEVTGDVRPDKCVCRVMPEFQKSHVQGGDRVVSIERTVQRVAAGN